MINPVKDRQEEEFQKIRADIKAELSVIKDIPTAKEMAWGLIAVFLGAVGLIVALAAVMGDRFDNGISIGSSIGERLEETKALNLENSRNMKRLLEKLETIPPEAPKP